MPSHRAGSSVVSRRKAPSRSVNRALPMAEVMLPSLFEIPVPALPPGVVDTRPAGSRIVDIRGDAAPASPAAGATAAPGQRRPGSERGTVFDGVIDTRPLGIGAGRRGGPARTGLPARQADTADPFAPIRRTVNISAPLDSSVADLWGSTVGPSVSDWLPTPDSVVAHGRRPEVESVATPSTPLVEPFPPVTSFQPVESFASVESWLPAQPWLPAESALPAEAWPDPFVPSVFSLVDSPQGDRAAGPSPYRRRSELRKLESRRSSRAASPLTGPLKMPQVGIASALGLATIAAPLTGSLAAPSNVDTSAAMAIVERAAVAAPAFPQLTFGPANAVEDTRLVTDDTVQASVPAALSAPARLLVTRASRGAERSVLPGCTGEVTGSAITAAVNGRLPAAMLCTLWDKNFQLRADAAVSLAKLNVAFNQALGRSICVTDAYRTLAAQYAIKAQRGYYAAAPGTSEHGEGLAIDLCDDDAVANSTSWTWLRANAPRYGWDNPLWARSNGSGPFEPWHFEYLAGEDDAPGGD